jgi:DNA-binding transcriptional ArsR family regulator
MTMAEKIEELTSAGVKAMDEDAIWQEAMDTRKELKKTKLEIEKLTKALNERKTVLEKNLTLLLKHIKTDEDGEAPTKRAGRGDVDALKTAILKALEDSSDGLKLSDLTKNGASKIQVRYALQQLIKADKVSTKGEKAGMRYFSA